MSAWRRGWAWPTRRTRTCCAPSTESGRGKASPDTWRQHLAAVRAEVASTEEALRQARKRQEQAGSGCRRPLGARAHGEQPESKLITSAEVEVNHPTGGAVTVGVAYLVSCAVWRPAYRATLRHRGRRGRHARVRGRGVAAHGGGLEGRGDGLLHGPAHARGQPRPGWWRTGCTCATRRSRRSTWWR